MPKLCSKITISHTVKTGGKMMTQKSMLYRQINALCAERGITLAQLAKKLEMTPQNLYARLDRERLTYNELSKIAEVLQCSFRYDFQPLNQ